MSPKNSTITTEYGRMKDDEIISMIKDKMQLTDDKKGIYDGYHSSGTPYTVSSGKKEQFSQADIMMSILKGNDTFAVLPTGSGKSACYQGPAMFVPGITLIVSPLIALIEDQIDNFNKRKIKINGKAIKAISPRTGAKSQKDFFDKISTSHNSNSGDILYKLAYVSPERLSNPKFQRELSEREEKEKLKISLLVIDEAHCLSQSSLDFRESYLFIYDFIHKRPFRPTVCAFTATASSFDKMVIERVLGFTDRKNYNYYEVIRLRSDLIIHPCHERILDNDQDTDIHTDVRFESLIELLKDPDNQYKRTVIFCTTVAQVDWLYENLCNIEDIKKYRIHRYHASMTRPQRKRSLERFSSKKYVGQIMIATKAMGLGIDINNISLIIHYDIPRTLEDYYQEIGRGARGNDQIKASCYLLYESGAGKIPSNGSVRKTEKWIRRTSTLNNLQCMTIASRLSIDSQLLINRMNIKRFNEIKNYITKEILPLSSTSTEPHKYITKKLKSRISKSVMQETGLFLANLESVLKDVYEFHFGNSSLINMLRWHPNDYELNVEKLFKYAEWHRKNPKNKSYHTIIKTDIAYNSVFVVIKGLKDDYMMDYVDVLQKLNEAWHDHGLSPQSAEYLYLIADSLKLTILDLFIYDDGEWKFDENDPLRIALTSYKTDVKGLLPESRYPEWHVFIHRSKPRVNESCVGPFAFIRGSRKLSVRFKLVGDRKPDYFDLCVSDAIYTLYQKGITHIYTKKIWEVLSGDPNVKFSRADSKIKCAIENSVRLLSDLKVCISDTAHNVTIENKPFMSVHRISKMGFILENTPPLYSYSELLNGEFIRVPVSLLSLHLHQHLRLNQPSRPVFFGLLQMPEPTEVKIQLTSDYSDCNSDPDNNELVYQPQISGESFASCKTDSVEWPADGCRTTKRLLCKDDFTLSFKDDPMPIRAKCRPWQATIENCVICHYLIHRISIARGRRRGKYLNFDNMWEILKCQLTKETAANRERFIRKVLAVLSYFREIRYVDFEAYINNPSILSSTEKERALQVEYGTFATIRRVDNVGFVKFHDINLIPSAYHTGNSAFHVEIADLTGVRFIKKEVE